MLPNSERTVLAGEKQQPRDIGHSVVIAQYNKRTVQQVKPIGPWENEECMKDAMNLYITIVIVGKATNNLMMEDRNPWMVKSAVEGQWSNDFMKHRKIPDCETLKLRRGRNECNESKANGTNAMDLRSGWRTDARLFTQR